ncbi:VOC family protein [Flavihumibacter solisilvae]|uniref:VOC domain-containing protein n=1 Tax=Flavihumibacter solisilvae TaxID=1349421 RepID=A0A0C1IYY4_9BACT|nr:VOC family protein [Flavihumibacter solisilvae]KIC95704.1 hypothetical protein OI18_05595 [Flavihumibacter solisilvae]
MSNRIFVNLPVKDLDRSIGFFTSLGFSFNPQFTDEKATCMVIGDNIYIMLLVNQFFKTFTKKELVDASRATECIIALSVDDRSRVDDIADKAIIAGAFEPRPAQDQGFMYYRNFQDLDGHLWEVIHMDESVMEQE